MGIRTFFHKIKMGFVRYSEPSIPYVPEAKKYGNYGEDKFPHLLQHELPSCKIKRNIIITTPEGNAEIDCLILYQNKLFAIEVKRWKGQLTEQENGFLQEKTDQWTNETHTKHLKSPFKQLKRAIFLLKKQIPEKAWVNAVVYFENDGLESISTFSENIWFDRMSALSSYIQNEGQISLGTNASAFFDKCVPADYLFAKTWDNSLYCIIDRTSLPVQTPQDIVSQNNIVSIRISHRWSCDELYIKMTDNSVQNITLENEKIRVNDNGHIRNYALCKLDYIELGRTLNPQI